MNNTQQKRSLGLLLAFLGTFLFALKSIFISCQTRLAYIDYKYISIVRYLAILYRVMLFNATFNNISAIS
jgi:hypothetical protein